MKRLGSAARTFVFLGAWEEIDRTYQERGWTDGLPIVPPTETAVEAMLRVTDRDRHDVIAVIPPRQGEATVERIAVNAVMAGCRPEHLPILIAAFEAVSDLDFNLDAIQATTHPVAPLVVVNGPIAREVGLHSGCNAFGPGCRANVAIGRAVRLVLMNVGGGIPGSGDFATQGSPAKIAFCVAENEADNPWQPLHVECGHPSDASVVTVFACEGPHNIQDHYSSTGSGILSTIAGSMGQAGSNNLLVGGWPLLCLGPEHAATLAADGFSKQRIKELLFEDARFPLARLGPEYRAHQVERWGGAAPDRLPIVRRPEDISVIVLGGAGKHSSWHPTFGDGSRPIQRVIARRGA